MVAPRTFLAPGQRYAEPGPAAWRPDRQLTVVGVGYLGPGPLRVTCRGPHGDRLVLPAAQVEAAVAAGQLIPVVAGSGLGWAA